MAFPSVPQAVQSYIPLHNRNYLGCSLLTIFLAKRLDASFLGKQGGRSGESTRLPPMWPASITGLGVICGWSLLLVLVLAPRVFLRVLQFLLPPEKPTFLNSNSTWNARTPLNEFLGFFVSPWVNKLRLHFWNRFRSLWHQLPYCGSSAVTWPSLM